MKIYLEDEKIFVKGFDKVRVRSIWLILLICIPITLVIFNKIFSINTFAWVLIFLSIILILFTIEFSFQFKFVIQRNKLSITRQFLSIEFLDFNFPFDEVIMNDKKEWIEFRKGKKRVQLETDDGLERNTIHVFSDEIKLELGRRNDGARLMEYLSKGLLNIGVIVL